MTSASDSRWHQIPGPTARMNRVENAIIDVYAKIAEIHKAIAELRIQQERTNERVALLEEYVYN